MTDGPSADTDHREPAAPAAPDPCANRRAGTALHGATLVLTVVALTWLVRLVIVGSESWGEWGLQLVLTSGLAAAGGWLAVWSHRHWTLPARQLISLIPQVQSGELPIESLSSIKGGPVDLVPAVQDLLHELRRRRADVAALEQEIGQRVASRTDALERALGSLKQQAVRDPLTGLYNRRMLDEHLPRLVERRGADGGALCLLMVDVDHFKLLNDTLGHAAGDELLRSIGQLIRSSIREGDLAFRCGGDEFVVLLDGCNPAAAQRLAERVTSLVDGLAKPLRVPRPPRLSIGISHLADLADPSPHALMKEADRVLYQVKRDRKRKAG